jgi:hypothetical protein
MSLYSVYYVKSDLNVFENISPAEETVVKLPKGYTFNDHIWANLYNTATGNKIGYIIVNSYYVNIDPNIIGGNVTDNAILFIESELPIGSINYLYNFYTNTNTTLIPPSKNNAASPYALSGAYYGREMAITINIDPSETRTVTFFVK